MPDIVSSTLFWSFHCMPPFLLWCSWWENSNLSRRKKSYAIWKLQANLWAFEIFEQLWFCHIKVFPSASLHLQGTHIQPFAERTLSGEVCSTHCSLLDNFWRTWGPDGGISSQECEAHYFWVICQKHMFLLYLWCQSDIQTLHHCTMTIAQQKGKTEKRKLQIRLYSFYIALNSNEVIGPWASQASQSPD